jgi:hypothetical protein
MSAEAAAVEVLAESISENDPATKPPPPLPSWATRLLGDWEGRAAGGAVYHRSDNVDSRPSSVLPSTAQTARGIGLAKISDEVESIF